MWVSCVQGALAAVPSFIWLSTRHTSFEFVSLFLMAVVTSEAVRDDDSFMSLFMAVFAFMISVIAICIITL